MEGELPTDFFSTIFKSQTYECGWRALLAHAIALQRPLLAILAACYEVSVSVFTFRPTILSGKEANPKQKKKRQANQKKTKTKKHFITDWSSGTMRNLVTEVLPLL